MKQAENILHRLSRLASAIDDASRSKAVDTIDREADELRHVFALLVLGSFSGLPSPPAEISLGLLPYMEDDLRHLLDRIETAHDPLAELFSVLTID